MKYTVITSTEAEIDIDEAYIWYETRQIGLGDKFFASVNESMLMIMKTPFIYQEIHRGFRRCVIKKFPYGIYYNILSDISEVRVLGVLDFRRNPEIILKRL